MKGYKGLIAKLKNMTWDLMHVRHLYRCASTRLIPMTRYTFPALLTFDDGLHKILDEFPLHALAIVSGTKEAAAFPALACNWQDAITGTLDLSCIASSYEEDKILRRESRRNRS